jgi:hypothetical protein
MQRIEALTKDQEAELPEFRERWRAVGLSTAPLHEEAARSAVRNLYKVSECEEPLAVITLASPMACLLARAICEKLLQQTLSENQRLVLEKKLGGQLGGQLRDQLRGQLGDQLRGQLGDQLRGQLGDQLWDQLRGQLGDQLWGQLRGQLRGQLGDQLRDQLRGQLGDQLRGQLWGQLRGQLRDQLRGQLGGQLRGQLRGQLYQEPYLTGGQDAFWLAFYEFGEKIGARYSARAKEHLEAYRTYALTCGWMFPYKSLAFVSDRPAEIHFDAQRRLHSANGMAVRFRDGWGVHAWHGLRVPPRLIEVKAFSPDAVENETNAEFRRVLLEREYSGRSGFELYAEQRQAKVIAEDILHGFPRRLLEVNVRGDRLRVIEVVNGSLEPDGTRRKFHLGAMRGDSPHDVVAASYGISPKHYREAVRS